jgi:protein involved in polysaccharide export with SLBB domain
VTVGGDVRKTLTVPVSAEGQLVIPDVGATDVAGIPLGDALRRIQETIGSRYRGASVIVTLGQPRIFPVSVLGYVKRPRQYLARGVDCVSELILRAGGLPRNQGVLPSMRNIQIRRSGPREGLASAPPPEPSTRDQMQVVGRADLLLWQRTGDPAYNPFISDGDVILVPARGDSIGIYGAVNMEGYYEFAEGDRLSNLVQLGGGLIDGADRRGAELLRLTNQGTTQRQIDLTAVLEGDPAHDILLQKGDRLHVLLEKKLVTVEGEVKFPGPYPIQEGKDRLGDILERAGGVTGEASLEQASVIRWSGGDVEDPEFERLKGFPPQQLTKEQQEYLRFRTRERAGQMAVDFVRLLRDHDESENIALSRNDRIVIPRASRTVTVSGQVANPSAFLHNPAYGIQDYIRLAGGFSKTAQEKNVRVIRGKTGKWIDADYVQQVEPGDTILVPEKPPRDGWRIFLDGMQVVSQIVTIIYIIKVTARGN